MEKSKYMLPELTEVRIESKGLICESPQGSVEPEKFSETEFQW